MYYHLRSSLELCFEACFFCLCHLSNYELLLLLSYMPLLGNLRSLLDKLGSDSKAISKGDNKIADYNFVRKILDADRSIDSRYILLYYLW